VRRRARARGRTRRIAAGAADESEIRTDHGGHVDSGRVDGHEHDHHLSRGVEFPGRATLHRVPDDDRRAVHHNDGTRRNDDDCLDRSASRSFADDATAVAVYDVRRGHLDDPRDDDNDRAVNTDDLITPSRGRRDRYRRLISVVVNDSSATATSAG
jgi:hypothetical protein